MNLNKSKVAKLFVGIAGLAIALAFFVTPVAKAATIEEQIAALLAQIQLLQGQMGGGTSGSASYTFNNDLTIGSTGSDVTALQTILVEKGYLTMPAGVAKGYFGSLTAAAVKSWQVSVGLPSTGFFGPMSRGKINAMVIVTPPVGGNFPAGCTSASGFSSTTGMPCSTVSFPAGCTSASGFSSTTGKPCNSTTPTGPTVGVEGSITTRLAATPTNNANVRQTTDVQVYGIEIEAVNSDMLVDRADLEFAVTSWDSASSFGSGSVMNPGNFINTIKAWDGSTLLGSWSVNNASFSKDSSDKYHIILSGLRLNVSKGTKKNITFSASVNSIGSTDVPRRVAVQGYSGNTQNIRATDTAGFQSYANMSGPTNTRTHDFKPAGSSTVTVTLDTASTPKASNNRLSTTNGITKKIMQGFSVKSESGDSKITKVYAAVNATATAGLPSTLYLCNGSDTACSSPLGSVSAAGNDGGEAAFTSLNILVPQDTTSKFLIAADFPTTANGQMASTSLMTNSIQWEKPDGSTASSTPSSELAGNDQYMATAVPVWTLIEAPTPVVTNPSFSGTATGTVVAKLKFQVTANGGALTKPIIEDFGLCFASSTQTTYTAGGVNCIGPGDTSFTTRVIDSISPTEGTVGDAGFYTVTVAAVLTKASCASTAVCQMNTIWQLVATSTRATVGGNNLRQTWNVGDFHTPFSATLQ